MAVVPILGDLVACPRCKSALDRDAVGFICENDACALARSHFTALGQVPVLVDFETSILDRHNLLRSAASSPLITRKSARSGLKRFIDNLPKGRRFAEFDALSFLDEAKLLDDHPVILVIGGGAVGEGAEPLYTDQSIRLIGTDIYVTPNVSVIADGHDLPLKTGSVHAIWIQAVLEHVLDPAKVVSEIHRVLVPNGIVYAETPFMQQVHEAAWDFTRFSLSGHRWLFRQFTEISAGVVRGPATTLLWAIRYFIAAVTGSYALGYRVSLMFFWLKYFERCAKTSIAVDGASGVYFFGRRSDNMIGPKDMVPYYRGAQ